MTDADDKVANRLAFLRVHLDDGVPLARAAREAGIPIRTARRWLACFRDAGPAGLSFKTRSDAGERKVAREVVELIEGMAFTKPRQSAATIHRRVSAVSRERKWRAPSYSRHPPCRTIGGLGSCRAVDAGTSPA
jgi:putative transposase